MKTPFINEYILNNTQLVRVSAEKDLGVTITGTLSWHPYIYTIITWDNKLLGLLKRTCPSLTDVSTRRAPYLSLVKSQLCYATQVWSPAQVSLKAQVERVQRRATRWILQTRIGEMFYKDRLITLDLLPLTYDRELKDLVFFYKCFFNHIHLDVCSFTNFISHGCTRLSSSFNLKTPICETSTFRPPTSIALWNFRITLVLLLLPLVLRIRSPSSSFRQINTFWLPENVLRHWLALHVDTS